MILSDLTNSILNKLDAISNSILTKLNTIENKITSSASGGSSVLRKITRGTTSGEGNITISCSITNPNKVIVLLDPSLTGGGRGSGFSYSGGAVYLQSVSNTNIIVYAVGATCDMSADFDTTSVTFSYQIIEFM